MNDYKPLKYQDQVRPGDLVSESDRKTDRRFDHHRANTQTIEGLYKREERFERLSGRLSECSTLLGFSSSEDGSIKLKRASFCRFRHCPICGWRRSTANVGRFMKKLPDLRVLYPTHRYLFLTLTVPNCPVDDLRATIGEMNKAWQRMIQRKNWPASGWIRTTEVTRGAGGSAHPHFHALLQVPAGYFSHGYIKHETWLQTWRDCMRDQSITQVDIRPVKPKIKGQDLNASIIELLKYGTKVQDLIGDDRFLFGLTDQLKGLRFIASGGTLKDLLRDEASNDEMIMADESGEGDEKIEPDLWFLWNRQRRRYSKV